MCLHFDGFVAPLLAMALKLRHRPDDLEALPLAVPVMLKARDGSGDLAASFLAMPITAESRRRITS